MTFTLEPWFDHIHNPWGLIFCRPDQPGVRPSIGRWWYNIQSMVMMKTTYLGLINAFCKMTKCLKCVWVLAESLQCFYNKDKRNTNYLWHNQPTCLWEQVSLFISCVADWNQFWHIYHGQVDIFFFSKEILLLIYK